jgi:hypothetical protein
MAVSVTLDGSRCGILLPVLSHTKFNPNKALHASPAYAASTDNHVYIFWHKLHRKMASLQCAPKHVAPDPSSYKMLYHIFHIDVHHSCG